MEDGAALATKPATAGRTAKSKGWLKKMSSKGDISVTEVFDALRPVLDKVLDSVALLDDVFRQVIIIKSQLLNVSDPQQMHQILEQVLELLGGIARNIDNERKDTEQFLGQLREKLQGIEQSIVGTLDSGSLSRAEALQSNIGGQVTDIQQAVFSEDTLDGLRQLIEVRVGKIGGTLSDYLDSEMDKHQQAERKVPDTNAEGALVVAEKARAGVEKCGFHSGGQPVDVTICCGITEVKDDDTPESAFERADQGMYKVKRKSRNGCEII